MRSRKFIHMGSIMSISIMRCLLARRRERKYPTGNAMTRQITVEIAAKIRLRANTLEYRPIWVRLSKVNWPSAFVIAYQMTMKSGTTVKMAIQTRYGPASQREDLDLSMDHTSERFMI